MELLLAVRSDDHAAAADAAAALERLSEADLSAGLPDDDARLAFWIDVYNASAQQQSLDEVASARGRLRLFRRPAVKVADEALSLDAIEHGILRRSRWKFGLGYLGNPIPSRFERRHRVEHIDARLHFALNCGAMSCPPIGAYEAAAIQEQLDQATRAFLARHVTDEGPVVRLPTVMLWFIGDFGGRGGLRRFLARYGIETLDRRIRFHRYDWTPAPGSWSSDDGTDADYDMR